MAASPDTLSIRDIFGFYVRDDGKVVLSISLDDETTVLTMEHDVAESIGISFLNAAEHALDVNEGRRVVSPGTLADADEEGQNPSKPVPWGPRRLNKPANKPN